MSHPSDNSDVVSPFVLECRARERSANKENQKERRQWKAFALPDPVAPGSIPGIPNNKYL